MWERWSDLKLYTWDLQDLNLILVSFLGLQDFRSSLEDIFL